MLKKGIILLSALILLSAGAFAAWIPAKSIVNPVSGTLYVVNNGASPAQIASYTYSGATWTLGNTKTLPAGAKCYGLAVNEDGNRLFISVNNGTSSKLRVYVLNAGTGLPTGIYTDANWVPAAGSSPMGIAVTSSGTRVYLADSGAGRLRYFDYDNGTASWNYTGYAASEPGIYDVALKSGVMGDLIKIAHTRIYVSKKVSSGKVLVYTHTLFGSVAYTTEITGLKYPTYLKVYGNNRLVAALNGPDDLVPTHKDIEFISTENHISQGWVGDGVATAYGWTAFDVADNGYVLYKRSQDAAEVDNDFYRTDDTLPNIGNGGDITEVDGSVNKCDSVAIAIDNQAIALTDSDDGSVEILDNSNESCFPYNASPVVTNLRQYEIDGSTAIETGSYLNYEYYLENGSSVQVVLKLDYSDSDGDEIDQVTLSYKHPEDGSWTAVNYADGEFTDDGSTISVTLPPAASLGEGDWEWEVRIRDNSGSVIAEGQPGSAYSETEEFQEGSENADFRVNTAIPQISSSEPANEETNVSVKQPVVITFSEPIHSGSFTYSCVETNSRTEYTGFIDPVWSEDNTIVTLDHQGGSSFAASTQYTMVVATAADTAENNISILDESERDFTFTTRATNEAPSAFNLISPINGQPAPLTPTLSWENNGDPEGDDVTYNLTVSNADGVAVVEQTGLTAANAGGYAIDLTAHGAGNYTWTVTAVDYPDGATTVAANAPASFTVVEDNHINPTVTSTTPLDGAENVAVNQAVIITFSESMSSASLSSDPAITWNDPTWNEDLTVATFTHDDFTLAQAYAVTISGQDLYGNNVDLSASVAALGEAPHTLDFTVSEVAEITISNVSIVRDGDAVGDSVTLTWDTNPAGSPVDIYTLTGDFSPTVVSGWVLGYNGVVSPQTDLNQVGNGTHKYYKLVPAGQALVDPNATLDVVGKFDLPVGDYTTEPEKFFVSFPLEAITSTSISTVLGTQASEGDAIITFDINKDITDAAYFTGGSWTAFPGVANEITDVALGYGYGYMTTTSKAISIVGRVLSASNSRDVEGAAGADMVAEWIGNAFPLSVAIDSAGFNGVATAGNDMFDSATAYHFDANADLLDIAIYTSGDGWTQGDYVTPATLPLESGKGYMFTEPGATFTWEEPTPY